MFFGKSAISLKQSYDSSTVPSINTPTTARKQNLMKNLSRQNREGFRLTENCSSLNKVSLSRLCREKLANKYIYSSKPVEILFKFYQYIYKTLTNRLRIVTLFQKNIRYTYYNF